MIRPKKNKEKLDAYKMFDSDYLSEVSDKDRQDKLEHEYVFKKNKDLKEIYESCKNKVQEKYKQRKDEKKIAFKVNLQIIVDWLFAFLAMFIITAREVEFLPPEVTRFLKDTFIKPFDIVLLVVFMLKPVILLAVNISNFKYLDRSFYVVKYFKLRMVWDIVFAPIFTFVVVVSHVISG